MRERLCEGTLSDSSISLRFGARLSRFLRLYGGVSGVLFVFDFFPAGGEVASLVSLFWSSVVLLFELGCSVRERLLASVLFTGFK